MPRTCYTHGNFIFIIQKHVYCFLQQRKRTQVGNRHTYFLTSLQYYAYSRTGVRWTELLFSATEIQRAIYITPAYPDSTTSQYSSRILLLSSLINSSKCCAPTPQVKYAQWITISHKKLLPNDVEIPFVPSQKRTAGWLLCKKHTIQPASQLDSSKLPGDQYH